MITEDSLKPPWNETFSPFISYPTYEHTTPNMDSKILVGVGGWDDAVERSTPSVFERS